MASMNKVILMGNVCRDIELRYTPSGDAVAEFSIAVNEKYKDKETTTFINVTVWKKQAENCQKYLQKGSSVLVDGKWSVDEWQDKDTGKKRQKAFVTVLNVQFLSSPSNQQSNQQGVQNIEYQDKSYPNEFKQNEQGHIADNNERFVDDQSQPF